MESTSLFGNQCVTVLEVIGNVTRRLAVFPLPNTFANIRWCLRAYSGDEFALVFPYAESPLPEHLVIDEPCFVYAYRQVQL